MAKRENAIPKAPAAKILHMAGGERVSDEAAAVFAEILEEIGKDIASHAVELCKHSGRKTVKGSDVKLAAKEL